MPPYDPENLFAKIIAGKIPCHKVFETEHAFAMLDAFPMVEGHCLLLPKYPEYTCAIFKDELGTRKVGVCAVVQL